MKYHLSILVSLSGIAGLAYSSGAGTNELNDTNSGISQQTEPYDLWKEHKILTAEQDEQAVYQAKATEIQSRIDLLRSEVASDSINASSTHETVESSRSHFSYNKSILKDTWREIYGEKKFVMSAGSTFVKFSGQILEVAGNGIRVFGQFGNTANNEYFVVNFPYDFKAGESVDPTKTYVALEDGTFSYVSEDGYAKSLPKLNYGKPCARPSNADAVEQSALQSQVGAAEQEAKAADDKSMDAQKRLQAAIDEIAAVRKEAAEKMRLAIEQALQYDQGYADTGNIDALRRMEDRYNAGDGVGMDANKAADYERKYQANFQTEAEKIAEKDRRIEQDALRQKFLRNIELADKRADVQSVLYVERCYRLGLGTGIDLGKADEYHAKAVTIGIPEKYNSSPLVNP